MIGQLVLVTYMWLNKDKYLIIMGDVVEKAWQNRTRKGDYMDAIQISVSAFKLITYQRRAFSILWSSLLVHLDGMLRQVQF